MIVRPPHPLTIFLVTFGALLLAAWFGSWLRRRRTLEERQRDDFSLILTATLTLLGLLIGFSFSMAANRYDQRKNLEEAEANAIGTEYLRADLLPAADRDKVRGLLKQYLEQRIRFYSASLDTVGAVNADSTRLQGALWSAVTETARRQPDPVTALVVAGMNDVINAQGFTQAAFWNYVPPSALVLMGAIAIICNVLLGYGARTPFPRSRLLLILPLIVALAFMLILDIDTPRRGFVNVAPQNLIALQESLK
jgi:hypothetical protein